MELGYHVTLVRDATAAYTPEAMHAAMNIDGPTYAHAIFSTSELVADLPLRQERNNDQTQYSHGSSK
jgi:nicotinamidase-related amidase